MKFFPWSDLILACENIRFSSRETSPTAKSEEKRMFSQANLILSRPYPRYSITEWEVSEISYVRLARWLLYVCLYREKAWFLYFSRSLLISYSITLSLEKEIIVLEKSLEKVLNFGSKNLYEPNPDSTYSETLKNHQGSVPRKMVRFNPGMSLSVSKVF